MTALGLASLLLGLSKGGIFITTVAQQPLPPQPLKVRDEEVDI